MDFQLNEDQRALQDTARRFAQAELPALARQLDEAARRVDAELLDQRRGHRVARIVHEHRAAGAVGGGLIAEKVGRRMVLPAAALLVAIGMATESVAPTWMLFVIGAGLAGAGTGALDAVVNSVVMDLSVGGGGSGLSRLHLFYSVGALSAALVVSVLAEAGVGWRAVAVATAIVGLVLALPLRRAGMVPPRRRAPGDHPRGRGARSPVEVALRLSMVALAVAIAAPSPSAPPGIARWNDSVAMRWVAFSGPPRVMT